MFTTLPPSGTSGATRTEVRGRLSFKLAFLLLAGLLAAKVSFGQTITTSFPATAINKVYAGLIGGLTATDSGAGASFTVSATGIGTNNLVITPSAGFAISSTNELGPFQTTSISFVPTAGAVTTKTIYVKMFSQRTVGTFTGTVTCAATGATTRTGNLTGVVVDLTPTPFGANNLVVLQQGDANYTQVAGAGPTFLQEVSKTTVGQTSPIASHPLPFYTVGTNRKLTITGSSTASGVLNISPDRKYVVLAGMDCPPGVLNTNSRNLSNYVRTIGLVTYDGNINARYYLKDQYNGADIRCANTTNGKDIWAIGGSNAGAASLNGTPSAIRYIRVDSATYTGKSVPVDIKQNNGRTLQIANSRLFIGANGTFTGVYPVGTTLPKTPAYLTTGDPANANGVGGTSGASGSIVSTPQTYGFAFADVDPTIPGNDVMYIADANGATGGIFKSFKNASGVWSAAAATSALRGQSCYGVYAEPNPTTGIDVYFTTADELFKVTDLSGRTGNMTGTGASAIPANRSTAVTAPVIRLYTSPVGINLRGVSSTPQNVITPDVAITFTNGAGPLAQGSSNNILSRIQLDVTGAGVTQATLSAVTMTTSGTYAAGDVPEFRLVQSTDGVLDAGDNTIATITNASGAAGQTLSFTAAQAVPAGTSYLFVVADVSGCAAVVGRSIGITSTDIANVEFFSSNSTGSASTASSYTVAAGTPSDVSTYTLNSAGGTITASWTNPSCFTNILVIADKNPISATPNTAASYTANSNYNTGSGTAIGATGRVVYQGTGTGFTLTGLTLGQTYYLKVFTKLTGTSSYSAGTQLSATAVSVTLYSRASGNDVGAIWAITPNGPATTAAVAAGGAGFSVNNNVVIQSGHTVNITATPWNVLNFTVMPGGALGSSSNTPTNPFNINLTGDFVNQGTVSGNVGLYVGSSAVNVTGNSTTSFNLIRKQAGSYTSTLTINGTVKLSNPGTTLYNNSGFPLNVVVSAGSTLTNTSAASAVSIDDVDGQGVGENAGSITVNGTLDAGRTLYAFNNNTNPANTTSITIGGTGTLLVDSALIAQTSTAPAPFTINAGGAFKVRRHVTLASGNLAPGLQLLSTNSYTARLAALSPSQTVGTTTVERTMPTAAGWHFIGAPVQSKFFTDWTGLGARLTPKNNANLFYYTEGDTTRGTYNGYLTEVNGWKVLPSTAQPINPSDQITGYRLYTAGSQKLSITGVPFIGDQTRNLTKSSTGYAGGGWNLIANPYPSEIDWEAFKTFNSSASLTGTVYIWNGTTKQYSTYTPGVGGTNGGSRYIQSSQGFQVKVTAPLTVTFKENQKAIASTGGSYLRSGIANSVHMFLENGTASDEGLLVFRSDATIGFDSQLDAYKLPGSDLNISTLPMSGLNLAVNAMPELTATQVIPVRTDVSATGTYTIRFTGVESLDAGLVMYLRDNYLNTLTDLAQTSTYAFTVTNNPATKAGRFEIVAGPASVTGIAKGVKSALTVYPNPANGAFTVSATGLKGATALVQVMTADGRVSFSSTPTVGVDGTVEVSVQTRLAAGVYTVRMVSAGQTVTQKLVVE